MILTADIGTTTVKTAIFTESGNIIGSTKDYIPLLPDMMADSRQWTSCLKKAFRSYNLLSQTSKKGIDAVAITGNGPTLVSSCGGPAMLWINRNANEECKIVQQKTGCTSDPSFFLPKALYFKKIYPDLYRESKGLMSSPEYVSYILTGRMFTFMPLEGLEYIYWTDEKIRSLDLDVSKFPPFISPGIVMGKVTQEASFEYGIPSGTPVVSGCPDFMASIIGSGTMTQSQACDRCGTSEGINLCSAKKVNDSRLMCYRHPNGINWNVSGIISTTGKAVESAKNLFGFRDMSYDSLFNLLDNKTKPGSGGIIFHPYLAGERAPLWTTEAKASFCGLDTSSTRENIIRSVCEGTCLAIADVLDLFDSDITELRAAGTPASNSVYNQMKADITGIPVVTLRCKNTTLLGCAILALSAINRATLSDTASSMVATDRTFEPDISKRTFYSDLLYRYRQTQLIW